MSGPNPEKGVGVTTLAKLFDLTPMRVQQLASAGVVVKVSHGTYALGESVKNYVKFLRERADKSGGSIELSAVKKLIAQEDLKMKVRENANLDRETVASEKMVNMIYTGTHRWNSALKTKLVTELPSRVVGKDSAEIREEMRAVLVELSAISRGIFIDEIEPELTPMQRPAPATEQEPEIDADDLPAEDR